MKLFLSRNFRGLLGYKIRYSSYTFGFFIIARTLKIAVFEIILWEILKKSDIDFLI